MGTCFRGQSKVCMYTYIYTHIYIYRGIMCNVYDLCVYTYIYIYIYMCVMCVRFGKDFKHNEMNVSWFRPYWNHPEVWECCF